MVDPVLLFVPLLVAPALLLFAFLGCAVLAPFDADLMPQLMPLEVEARFPLPDGVEVQELLVTVDVGGILLDGSAKEPEYAETDSPVGGDDDGELVYRLTFSEFPEGRYAIVCNVYAGPGAPAITSPPNGCVLLLTRELGVGRMIFRAEAGQSEFACGGGA
jgi:hypothetical protein